MIPVFVWWCYLDLLEMKQNVATDSGLEDSAYVCGAIVNARFNARLGCQGMHC